MFLSLVLCKGHISKTCHSNVSNNPSSKISTSNKIGEMSTGEKYEMVLKKGDDQCASQKAK